MEHRTETPKFWQVWVVPPRTAPKVVHLVEVVGFAQTAETTLCGLRLRWNSSFPEGRPTGCAKCKHRAAELQKSYVDTIKCHEGAGR